MIFFFLARTSDLSFNLYWNFLYLLETKTETITSWAVISKNPIVIDTVCSQSFLSD